MAKEDWGLGLYRALTGFAAASHMFEADFSKLGFLHTRPLTRHRSSRRRKCVESHVIQASRAAKTTNSISKFQFTP